MGAKVIVDPASPCFAVAHWPERAVRVDQLNVVDNGDGTVTATAVPYGDNAKARTATKTVNIDDHTQVKAPRGKPATRPPGGVLRWRCVHDNGADYVFSQKDKAEARAAAINEREGS